MKNFDLNELLEKLDDYFVGKNKTLYFLLAFVVIVYLGYAVIAPLCESLKDYAHNSLNQTQKIYASKPDPDVLRADIQKQAGIIEANKAKKQALQAEDKKYADKIDRFANDFFQPGDVNIHINKVANKAASNNVNIIKIENYSKGVDIEAKKLEPMYDLNLTFKSNRFEPVLRYLNSLESTTEISDIRDFYVYRTDGDQLAGHINVVTWGFRK